VGEYICPSVIDTILEMGLLPVLTKVGLDLNISTEYVEKNVTESTLAVLVAHMYSSPADIKSIEKICRNNNIILIDDAAQLGFASGRKALGSYGDFGLISFAQSKSIVAGVRGSGGILLINDKKLKEQQEDVKKLLLPSKGRLRQLFYFIFAYLYARNFGRFVYYYERLKSKLGIKKQNFYNARTISNFESALACAQYLSIDARCQKKIALKEYYHQFLSRDGVFYIPQYVKGAYLSRLYIGSNREMYGLRLYLAQNGISTRKSYAEEENLIEVPLHTGLSKSDVKNICDQLSKFGLK